MLTCRLKQIQRPHRIDIKIIEWPGRREIMARLSCSVYYERRLDGLYGVVYELPVPNIDLAMFKVGMRGNKPALIPASVALRTEEVCAHIVVKPINLPTAAAEMINNLGSYEARGAGNKELSHCIVSE